MRRTIQRYIEDPLSLMMIEGEVSDGSDVIVKVKNEDELDFEIKSNEAGQSRVPAESSAE